ncbi:hypothetical protein KM043_011848 [Ampulex compressa]|nr:hypothetical protein KM043_011848 [Ampulex compressa]
MQNIRLSLRRYISSGIISRNRLAEQTESLNKSQTPTGGTIENTHIEHFSKLADKWWNPVGVLRGLHEMNSLRVQLVRDGLANTGVCAKNHSLPLEGIKIADIGCGGGILSEPLARIGGTVTGLDASSDLIQVAKHHASLDSNLLERLHYVCSTIEEHATTHGEAYDAVVASEVLEHVADREMFLESCTKILKPGGSIFVTTINKTLWSWVGAIIAAEYILKLLPKHTHEWNKFVPPTETQRILNSYNCKTKLIHGMIYNPLKHEWNWTNNTAISYALQAVKQH